MAEKVAAEIVSLPMFPQLTAEQQARVVEEILSFTSKSDSQARRSRSHFVGGGRPDRVDRFSRQLSQYSR